MRHSQLFFKTFKEAPAEADIPSHQLLERGGYIKRLSRGHFTYTPLMMRVLSKMKKIIIQELEREGAQEISMPQMHPKSIWEESGRWEAYKAEKLTYIFEDREQNEFCLGPTHEEAVTSLVKNWVTSYKQLPINLFQITNKFRDEIRPRFGLMRAKEFLMKDAYTFCADNEQMEKQYSKMRRAYERILNRLDLKYVVVQADSGKIGNSKSEEFQVLADVGEDSLLLCQEYAFNSEKAPCYPKSFSYPEGDLELEKFSTPGIKTIQQQVEFVNASKEIMLKTLVYKVIQKDGEEFVAVGIRGDRDINKVKLINYFGALEAELATEEEIKKATGLEIGFIGPVDCPLPFVADHSCKPMRNFMCGANEKDYHYKNVQWRRDCKEPTYADFCQAKAGDACPVSNGGVYEEKRGIEVGHIFNLGDKYSRALKAFYQNEAGKPTPFLMGCFGLGVGRCIQAAVEQKYDEQGIVWPLELAPFSILLTPVNVKDKDQSDAAEKIYDRLLGKGIEVLYDDRIDRLGSKLKDSDLIGIPFKMIIGKQFLSDREIEVEPRQGEKYHISWDYLDKWIDEHLNFPKSNEKPLK